MARIVHVCPRYLPARGGVELFFQKISEDLVRHGHDVSVWTTDAPTVRGFTSPVDARLPSGPETVCGVVVRRFPVQYVPLQRYVRTAANQLPLGTKWKCNTLRWTPWVPSLNRAAEEARERIDVVHVAGLPYSSLLFAGWQLARNTQAMLVISPFTHVPPPGRVGPMRRAYLSPLNLGLLARADRIFVQTGFEKDMLTQAGLDEARQTIVGLGVDAADCTGGDGRRFRARHGLDAGAVVVGHLANKSWDKGTNDLLDAAERLWDRGADFSLVLAGSEMATFVERWQRVRHRHRIVNLGVLTDDERRDFYAGIDIFALPSYVESFGVSNLEAALNQVAVIAYAHGGPLQIFRNEEDALLIPVGDVDRLAEELGRVVLEDGLRERIGEGARRLAGRYSWSDVLDRVASGYGSVPVESGRNT